MSLRSLAPVLLIALLTATRQTSPVAAVNSARALFDAGKYAEARALLAPEAAKGSADADVYFWMGQCDFELHQFDSAIGEAEKAVSINPNVSEYHRLLGRAYGRKAEHSSWFSGINLAKKTRTELERAVELDPRNVAARRDLVNFYARAPGFVGGGESKALDQIQQVFALDPVEGHLARLDFYEERKQWDQAAQEAKTVLAAKPKSAEPYLEVAAFYDHRGDGAALRLTIAEGQANAGHDPRFDYYLGVAAVLTGDQLDQGEAALQRYLEGVPRRSGEPSPADADVWLGRLYEKQGQHDRALSEFHAALEADPNNKAAREALKHQGN
jgi:tetratricopeptide (TPR) repeat protein